MGGWRYLTNRTVAAFLPSIAAVKTFDSCLEHRGAGSRGACARRTQFGDSMAVAATHMDVDAPLMECSHSFRWFRVTQSFEMPGGQWKPSP
jgi:hypothetical protein